LRLLGLLLMGLMVISCAKKVPPPGKGEFAGPKLLVFSPEAGDTVGDRLKVYLYAEDSSGLSRLVISRRGIETFLLPLRGKGATVDTLLRIQREGESLLPDTLEISVFDRWDNRTSLKIEVFTFRRPPDTSGTSSGNQPK